jgi:hypothetical protein
LQAGRLPQLSYRAAAFNHSSERIAYPRLICPNPLLTYAQKPRTETEEEACSSEHAKETIRQFQHYATSAAVIDAATPRAAVGNGGTRRAVHTKSKTDRKAYNGCCTCGHRDSPVCLCVYLKQKNAFAVVPVAQSVEYRHAAPRISHGGAGFYRTSMREWEDTIGLGPHESTLLPSGFSLGPASVRGRLRADRRSKPSIFAARALSLRRFAKYYHSAPRGSVRALAWKQNEISATRRGSGCRPV